MRIKRPTTPTSYLTTQLLKPKRPFERKVQNHITALALQLSHPHIQDFSTSPSLIAQNRVLPSIRRPNDFHTLLQSTSATNTLLLALFRTSTCPACSTITPLLESIVQSRAQLSPGDSFTGGIAFAELELDSPDRDDDTSSGRGWNTMYDVGIEYAVRSVPTLIGFGGRRAERITDRIADERKLRDRKWVEEWIDEVMKRGDPSPSEGKGILGRLFGGGSGGG